MKNKYKVSLKYFLAILLWLFVVASTSLFPVFYHPPKASAIQTNNVLSGNYENDRVIKITRSDGGVQLGNDWFSFNKAVGDYTYAGTGFGSENYIASSSKEVAGTNKTVANNYWERDEFRKQVEEPLKINLDNMKRYNSNEQGKGLCKSVIYVDTAAPAQAYAVLNPAGGPKNDCFMRQVTPNNYNYGVAIFNLTGTDKVDTIPNEGEWRDMTTIVFGGKFFRDSAIFDRNHSYESVDGGDCRSSITIANEDNGESFENRKDSGELIYRKKTATRCEQIIKKRISLKYSGSAMVNAYEHGEGDDKIVLLPQYIDLGNLKKAIDAWYGVDHTRTMGFFKQLPTSDSRRKKDIYWLWSSGSNYSGQYCDDVSTTWVDRGDSKMGVQTGGCRDINHARLSFAPFDPPADVYGTVDWNNAKVTGANGNPGGSSYGSVQKQQQGEAKPTCESNNGTMIIGWLICGFLGFLDNAIDTSTNVVEWLLTFDTSQIDPSSSGKQLSTKDAKAPENLHQAWSVFRVLSSVSLLAIALVMIIGQAIGGD